LGQAAFLLARDHLGALAGASLDGGDGCIAIRGHPEAGGAQRGDRPNVVQTPLELTRSRSSSAREADRVPVADGL
jgi:hypothetical protein